MNVNELKLGLLSKFDRVERSSRTTAAAKCYDATAWRSKARHPTLIRVRSMFNVFRKLYLLCLTMQQPPLTSTGLHLELRSSHQ